MSDLFYSALPGRTLVTVTGEDAHEFLQGLISNDISFATAERAIYASLLTAQGKFLHDFFVVKMEIDSDSKFVFEVESDRADDFVRRLTMYKMRANVDISKLESDAVYAGFGDGAIRGVDLSSDQGSARSVDGGVVYSDPRADSLGVRGILDSDAAASLFEGAGFQSASSDQYDHHRLQLGVPDGSRDIVIEKNFPLECGLDELNAIDYAKGCYIGQELTARTHHRGTIRKHLFPVTVTGPMPEPGTPILWDGNKSGEMRSSHDGIGIALLRIEDVSASVAADTPFVAGDARLAARKPDWAKF